jgi:hypothetical protein
MKVTDTIDLVTRMLEYHTIMHGGMVDGTADTWTGSAWKPRTGFPLITTMQRKYTEIKAEQLPPHITH